MGKEIIINERFNIPLYHATSSLFIDSIMLSGLGGTNIVEQYRLINLMKDLISVADNVLDSKDEWSSSRFLFEWMAQQQITASGSNYQHGHTYLTPSRGSAIRYALSNRLGSELLSNCELVWNLIYKKDPLAFTLPRDIDEIFSNSYKPIIITILGAPISALLSEDGSPVEHNINILKEFVKIPDILEDKRNAISINFRLDGILPANQFTHEYIDGEREYIPV